MTALLQATNVHRVTRVMQGNTALRLRAGGAHAARGRVGHDLLTLNSLIVLRTMHVVFGFVVRNALRMICKYSTESGVTLPKHVLFQSRLGCFSTWVKAFITSVKVFAT